MRWLAPTPRFLSPASKPLQPGKMLVIVTAQVVHESAKGGRPIFKDRHPIQFLLRQSRYGANRRGPRALKLANTSAATDWEY
jgi:hypothetical protein